VRKIEWGAITYEPVGMATRFVHEGANSVASSCRERNAPMKQSKRFRKALRGLEGMIVWVHDVAPDAAADGLSRQHLQDAVVVRLLDSGIKALGIGNVPEPPGNPWLNIFVSTIKSENHYFYFITVRLDEVVRPDRNKTFRTIGTTWETCSSGVILEERLSFAVENTVDDLIDCFIYDFHLENPR